MKNNHSTVNYDAPLLTTVLSLLFLLAIPLILYTVSVNWSDSLARIIVVGFVGMALPIFTLKKEKYYLLILAFIFLSQFSISLHTFELTPPETLRVLLFDVVLVLLVWTTIERNVKWSLDKLAWLYAAFIIWELIATGYSAHFDRSIVHNSWYVKYMLIYLIALNMPLTESIIKKIQVVVMTIVLIQSLIGFLQYMHGGVLGLYIIGEASGENLHFVKEALRISGTIGNTNSYAGYMALLLVFLTPFLLLQKNRFLYGVYVVGCIALLLSFSRAGWLSLFLGGVIVVFLLLHNKLIRFTKILGFTLVSSVLLLIIIYMYFDKITDRFQSHEAVSSAQSRIDYTTQSLEVIKNYPLFGIGPGVTQYLGRWNNYEKYVKESIPNVKVDNMVHNGHLQIWMEGGTPAFIIWMLIVIYILVSVIRGADLKDNKGLLSLIKIGSGAAAIAILVDVSFGTEINQIKIMSLLWCFLGLNRNKNYKSIDNRI